MKALFSRYGGNALIIGKGKASNLKLPVEQTLDTMLDDHSEEILPNVFNVSSYDLMPSYMGAMEELPKEAVHLGTLDHTFMDLFMQYDLSVSTEVYLANHDFKNVYMLILKTDTEELEDHFGPIEESYDYVQTTFFSDAQELIDNDLCYNPQVMEVLLYILFFKMGIAGTTFTFTPSETYLGRKISEQFCKSFHAFFENIDHLDALKTKLKKEYYPLFHEAKAPLFWSPFPSNEHITNQYTKELEVYFTTCIFRTDRIIEKLGSLRAFQELMEIELITNGPLVIAREMLSPATHLEERILERLYPLGFGYKKDFAIMEEQIIYGVKYSVTELLNHPLPENATIDWLESAVRFDGNFVWWKELNKC